ncbi:hypothetical protein RJ639_016005 [Escallonia herrerae]|uniref:RIN4 pathogenic type III effector avirulence factor Avr cleavage site domain-containing protein n=1 Tax=Escallonia herrerae TaxID=1293975 RepID=A0AA88VIP3_9ASTE|nr:hypothetical protein RJ639_016005 [Escallonia herrerae]
MPKNISYCCSQLQQGRPLPKFGEWDASNPASADGFTVIFAKARDEKKTNGTAAARGAPAPQTTATSSKQPPETHQYPPPQQRKWFCCF